MPHATDISWYYDETNFTDATLAEFNQNTFVEGGTVYENKFSQDYFKRRNESLTKQFPIDLLNSKGSIRIRVMADYLTKRVEVARVHLPVFNLLDCVCLLPSNESYTRWFPLCITKEIHPGSGDFELFEQGLKSERESPFEYEPCIRLSFKWIPDKSDENHEEPSINDQKMYWRLNIPLMSVSVIDSENAREVVQLCASRLDIRNNSTKEHTEYLAYIDSFQVRNFDF